MKPLIYYRLNHGVTILWICEKYQNDLMMVLSSYNLRRYHVCKTMDRKKPVQEAMCVFKDL